jgi:hypothetical protein
MSQRVQHFTKLLTAQAALDTAARVRDDLIANCREHTFYATWTGAVSAGVITIEASADPTYTGTWSSIGTINFVAGACKHLSVTGCHRSIRVRISTAVVGGTVDVAAVSN